MKNLTNDFKINEIVINSKKEKGLYLIFEEVNNLIDSYDVSFEIKYHIEMIIEEVYTNIVNHAYGQKDGLIRIKFCILSNPMRFHIIFIDDGEEFNPLESQNPELSDNIDDVTIGSLGIVYLKELSSDLSYEYKNNQNILSVTKNLEI